MKIQEILDNWDADSKIDQTRLTSEALNGDRLHHKYIRIQVADNIILARMKADYNQLVLRKYQFYTEGALSMKEYQKGPARGAVLKSEAEKYILGDDEIIEASKNLAMQQEKCDLLKSILFQISKRSFSIQNAIAHLKYMSGA